MISKEQLDALSEDLKVAESQKGDYLYCVESAGGRVSGWITEYEEREQDPPYYWDMMSDYDADESVEHVHPYGQDTARIISQEHGGVIAYVHKDHADMIVKALWIAS